MKYAILLAVLCLAGCSGCSATLTPKQLAFIEAHECYFAAIEPVAGPLAEEILASVLAGGGLNGILRVHGVSEEAGRAVIEAFNACAIKANDPRTPLDAGTDS